ncbi:MAG: hypothetical protein J3R72DRAFT_151969 [Linnemannia gamsii]|nr:MAG: hypothetical protein J3R72DRAFT_151969 [Linnemannia gamsii]
MNCSRSPPGINGRGGGYLLSLSPSLLLSFRHSHCFLKPVPTMSEQDYQRKDAPSPATPSTSQPATPSAVSPIVVRTRSSIPRPEQAQVPSHGYLVRPANACSIKTDLLQVSTRFSSIVAPEACPCSSNNKFFDDICPCISSIYFDKCFCNRRIHI